MARCPSCRLRKVGKAARRCSSTWRGARTSPLRQLYQRVATARGHWTVVGTPQSIADELEHWFTTGAADGFNIMAPTLPYDLQDFVALVIPELQRRGLFRTAYQGRTLREHLGLPRPAHPAQLRALDRPQTVQPALAAA